MRTGLLNKTIAIVTLRETEVGGDVTQTDALVKVVRAAVNQVIGTRYMRSGELVDRVIYEIRCWDWSLSHDIKILYGNLILHPIAPIQRIKDRSFRDVVKIIAATKAGDYTTLTTEEMKYTMTTNLAAGVVNTITTPLTTKPYNVEFIDSANKVITVGLGEYSLSVVGGVYVLSVYSAEALNNVEVKFIY